MITEHWKDGDGIVHSVKNVWEDGEGHTIGSVVCLAANPIYGGLVGPAATVTDPVTCLGCLAAEGANAHRAL